MDYSVKYGITIDDYNIKNAANATANAIVNMLSQDFNNIKTSLADVASRIGLINSAANGAYAAMQALNNMNFKNSFDAIDGLINKLNSIPRDITTTHTTVEKVVQEVTQKKDSRWAHGHGQNEVWESVMAKGGIVTANNGTFIKKSPNDVTLNDLAHAVGEDTMIAAKYGERVLTKEQTKTFDDFVYNKLPNLTEMYPIKFMPNVKIPDYSSLINNRNRTEETTLQFNGDLSFPNITNGNDAKDFINQLKHLKVDAIQYANKRF